MTALLLAVILVLAVAHGRQAQITDGDELWHLATGKLIVESGSVPDRDPFSLTAGDTVWTNTNWLAQVVLYELWKVGGFEAVWLLGFALFAGACGLACVLALRRSRSPLAALAALAFVWRILETGSSVRPQGWTFFLLAAASLLVDRIHEARRAREGVALGAVLALSVQLHGGFIFPFGVAAAALLSALRARDKGRAKLLALALGIGLVSFLLHPHRLEAFLHPFRYVLDPRFREMNTSVVELMPPDLSVLPGALLEVTVLALLGLFVAGRPALRVDEILSLVALLHLALSSTRGLHYLALVAAAPLACGLAALLVRARDAEGRLGRLAGLVLANEASFLPAARLAPFALLAAVPIVALIPTEPLAPGRPRSMDSKLFLNQKEVADVASYVLAKEPPGAIYNDLDTGGAFIWTLYPDRRVYFDGRGDLYARSNVWHEMEEITHGRPGWERLLEARGIDTVVTDLGSQLDRRLENRRWRTALTAQGPVRTLVVLVRPGSAAERKLLP